MAPLLKLQNLSVSYGQRLALQDITLQVPLGKVMALIGPNGAGKSTLIRAASGILPGYGGSIHINGDEISSLTTMQRARSIAVVPQAVSLPPAFTAWETVLMGRTPYLNFLGQTSASDENIVRDALARVDALDFADRRVGELSGGEQQRILLARALAQSTPILLLDEPTAHLDMQYQVSLMQTISRLAHDDNLAVMIALHDLNIASRYSDLVALLIQGRLDAVGEPAEVLTAERISNAYHLLVEVIQHPFQQVPLILPTD
jgi:iron complex transport system ATP-binding protein